MVFSGISKKEKEKKGDSHCDVYYDGYFDV